MSKSGVLLSQYASCIVVLRTTRHSLLLRAVGNGIYREYRPEDYRDTVKLLLHKYSTLLVRAAQVFPL